MSRKYSDASAIEVLTKAGATPLEAYQGSMSAKWKCQCTSCGHVIYPRMVSLARGSRACRYCYLSNPVCLKKLTRKYSEESAIEILAKAGAIPLEPYPGNMSAKWKCQCTSCRHVIYPRMFSLARGIHSCRNCYGPKPIDPNEAKLTMIAAGVEPLEPFPGSKKPWKVRCFRCGRDSTPMYCSIKMGQGGCFRCGRDYGDAPAHVYLVHDFSRSVIKIGITNDRAHRMIKYSNWNVVEFIKVPTGRMASAIEAEVLRKWRIDLELPPKLTRNEMPDKGYTETADEIGLSAALYILQKHK